MEGRKRQEERERERGMLRGWKDGRKKRDYRALSFCIPCTKCWSNGRDIREREEQRKNKQLNLNQKRCTSLFFFHTKCWAEF
jgi:hypothetical protein